MSRMFVSITAQRAITAGLATLALALMAGCSTFNGKSARYAPATPSNLDAVQGRDLGKGGATSGGLSSLDPTGNAADHSPLAEETFNRER
jgi:hypothetical protein